MKKIYYILLLLLVFAPHGFAQGTGSWETHFSYYNTTEVVEADNYVFGVANGSLYSYAIDDKSIHQYTIFNGLSDTQIKTIGYSKEHNILAIVYTNGNIDLLTPGTNNIKNLPYLKQDINVQDKTINEIYFHGSFAYLSAQFGIVVVNIERAEIANTYKLNAPIYSVCIEKDYIYASTGGGVLRAPVGANLLDYNNWHPYPLSITLGSKNLIRKIGFFDSLFTFFVKGESLNGVFCLQADGSTRHVLKDTSLENMTLQNGMLIAHSNKQAIIMSSFSSSYSISNDPIYGVSSLKNENTFWLATGDKGIKGIRENGDKFDILLTDIVINSPMRNNCAFMTFANNKLIVAGGGRWTNREEVPGTLMVHDSDGWFNFLKDDVQSVTKVRYFDLTAAAINPNDDTHYFASSWGEGLYEFKDNKAVKLYNTTNSPLETIYPNNPALALNYIRVEGVRFDKEGNLWMTNSQANHGIKVLKADKTWAKMPYLNGNTLIDKILITSKNHKWVNVLREQSSIFILDDKGTIDDLTDDRTRSISRFYNSSGSQLNAILSNFFYCMAEDKNGKIWIGTNIGPIIINNPSALLDNPDQEPVAYRPIRIDEEGLTGYLLESENIKAIAVDGGNRIWLGTEKIGVVVVSDDGLETYEQFTTDNSPLPSNNIQSLAINPNTGEVFIGTDKGIVSYNSGATEGGESYSDVYAYPNPVRPEYQDMVTITGLMEDSNVKITDINGNLIIQGKSLGGQFTWDCRKNNGQRVATGIYLVMAAQPDRGESVVTKIMVVK